MDLRAVILCLCLLIAQSDCAPTGPATQKTSKETQRAKEALKDIQEVIKITLDNLTNTVPDDSHNNSRVSLNNMEVLTIQDYIPCLIHLSKKLPERTDELSAIAQAVMDFAKLTTYPPNCSLPLSEPETVSAMETKILLEHLQKRLEKTQF